MKKIRNCIKTWPPKPTAPASFPTQFCGINNACELRLIFRNMRLTWEIKGNTPHSLYLPWFVGWNFFLSSEVIALQAKKNRNANVILKFYQWSAKLLSNITRITLWNEIQETREEMPYSGSVWIRPQFYSGDASWVWGHSKINGFWILSILGVGVHL